MLTEKEQVIFQCNYSDIFSVSPPQSTYKVQIKVLLTDCNSGTVELLSENKQYNNTLIKLERVDDNLIVFEGDWYGIELGLKYTSNNSTSEDDDTVRFEIVFFKT